MSRPARKRPVGARIYSLNAGPVRRQRVTLTFVLDMVAGRCPTAIWVPKALRRQVALGIVDLTHTVRHRHQVAGATSSIQVLARFGRRSR